jgi:Uncharacterized stress protein (general stress protein 26)
MDQENLDRYIGKALDLINRCQYGMLGNISEDGSPQIKAMIKTKNIGLKMVWFCSNTSSKRVAQIKSDGNTCLYFFEGHEGLMLRGWSEILYDDHMRNEFWQDFMYQYYPQGPSDPDFALIKFTAKSGNYYKSRVNKDFLIDE